MKKSLARKIMFIVSAALLFGGTIAFLIAGFVNVKNVADPSAFASFPDVLKALVVDGYKKLFNFSSYTVGYCLTFTLLIICAALAVTLLVLAIVRKKKHYYLSALYLLAGGYIYSLLNIYHIDTLEADVPAGGITCGIGLVGGLCMIAFAFVDIFAKGKEVKGAATFEPEPKEETPKAEEKPAPKKAEKASKPAAKPAKKQEAKPAKKAEEKPEPKASKPAPKKASKKVEVVEEEKPEKDGPSKMYHVSRREDLNKWQVKAENADKAIKLFNTQAEALQYAKEKGNVKLHSKAGKIRKA